MRIPAMRSRRTLAFCLCLISIGLLLTDNPIRGLQQATISIDVKVITLLATVRDRKGKIISDLVKSDFKLEEDGRPQTIRYFSKETDLPLSLGLLVDTSGSQRGVLSEERSASHSFLADLLRPAKDKAFIIHFDYEVELLQDLTSSRDRLESALAKLDQSPFDILGAYGRRSRSPVNQGSTRGGFGGGGTLLYDAVFLASDEVIRKQQDRKALILLSDGVDNGSRLSIETAIMTAQRADTVVYSILFTDRPQYQIPFDVSPNGKKILEQISNETGGRMFEVTKKQSIGDIYKTIAEELRNQYSIGYTPTETSPGQSYRKLHLTANRKDSVVRTRDGYYPDGSIPIP